MSDDSDICLGIRRIKRIKREIVESNLKIVSDDEESSDSEGPCIIKKLRNTTDDKLARIKHEVSSSGEDEDDIASMARRKQRAEELSPEQKEIIRNLVINLKHEVLPQHQLERSAGTRAPSAREKEEFKKIEPDMKKGVFNSEEDQQIADNWESFCKIHNLDPTNPKPFLFHRHQYWFYLPKFEERKKFVQFLAHGLPKRSLYSVYHRFRNLYDTHKVDKYSFYEDQHIIRHIEMNPHTDDSRKFADLAKVLNRTRASVWRRYRLLIKKRQEADESD